MKRFDLKVTAGYITKHENDVLDVWCENDKIKAYVQDKIIYKLEMVINEDRITDYYCSCNFSNGGMNFCKHLASLEKYVIENEIPELECEEKKETKVKFNIGVGTITENLKDEIKKLLDSDNRISCYRSKEFSDLITKYCEYITRYLEKDKLNLALNLIIEYLDIINVYQIDSEDFYNKSESEILSYLKQLIEEHSYRDKIIDRLKKEYGNIILNKTGTAILDVLINEVKNEEDAKQVMYLISKLQFEEYLDKSDIEEDVLNTLRNNNKEDYEKLVPPDDEDMEDIDFVEKLLKEEIL